MFRRRSKSDTQVNHQHRRGTTSREQRRSASVTRAVHYAVEELETRRLFNTIITDTNPLTATPATKSFEYKDAHGVTVRVTVHGDVSAEFIFARVTKGDTVTGAGGNDVILGEPVSPTAPDPKTGKLGANQEDGRDLFHVYVAQASIDSFISVAEVPTFSTQQRPMRPFTGAVGINIDFPLVGTDVGRTMDAGTGNIVLGTRTRDTALDIENEENHPIISARFNGQGLMPVTANNRLIAGLSTASGVSLGRFLFGGTVMGHVTLLGSMESFYCGALITGVASGQGLGSSNDPGNFYVQGDIRNILVKGSVGTNTLGNTNDDRKRPTYATGTDFDIHGRVGQIRVGGDYLGTGVIHEDAPGKGLRIRQQELEVRIDPTVNRGNFTEFENGQFGDNEDFFNNNDFNHAQFLGSINSKQLGDNTIQLNGLYQRVSARVQDIADFYAVPLMAGQQITVRLIAPSIFDVINNQNGFNTPETKSILHAGVFDPNQRLIASDYRKGQALTEASTITAGGNIGTTDTDPAQQELFSFTATKPGIYYIAVGESAPAFTSANTLIGTEQPYQLQITGVGNMGLGALAVNDTIFGQGGLTSHRHSIMGFDANIEVERGDLGAIKSVNDYIISDFTDSFNALADGGDLRVVEAVSLGQAEGRDATDNSLAFSAAAQIGAVTGSVGLIRSTGADDAANVTFINWTGRIATGNEFFPTTIGGDIQYIVSPTNLITDLACKGSIGVVQANNFGVTTYAGSLSANVDGQGKPATIDLIDITGDLGTLSSGGPIISTGPGGNVRYIHMADSSTAFRPRLFGGGEPEGTTFVQGQEADITDDSGAQVRLIPTQEDLIDPATGNPLLDPNTLEPISNSGTLTVTTYPIFRSPNEIQGGGGSVIIRVESTRGVQVRTSGGSAEIGTISAGTTDPGPNIDFNTNIDTANPDTGPDGVAGTGDDPFEVDPNTTNHLGVDLRGGRIDVFSIEGTGSNFESIRNRTTGEIVNVNVGKVGLIDGRTLGIATSTVRPGMDVEGTTIADNPGTSEVEGSTFPFLNAKNAIVINGGGDANPAVVTLRATESIGNVMILGRAENITANADGVGVKGVFEGIVGAIYAKGQLRNVNVGEGLMPSGTGNFGRAGIYCTSTAQFTTNGVGRIENVTNQGLNSDIRGDIIANTAVGKINLHDGSIINSDIMVLSASGSATAVHTGTGADLSGANEFGALVVVVGDIEQINVNGVGGIIGILGEASNIGPITSVGGFGLINSIFSIQGAGRFGAVTADGYGIRGVLWDGGQSLDSLTALGDGHRLTTTSFEPGVLLSGSLAVDPFFGTKPNPLTDLYVMTHTTPQAPQRKGVSASGSIDLSAILVSRDIGFIKANTLRADVFNIGNNISRVETSDYIDSLQLTAGRIDTLAVGKDALRSTINIAGPVGTVSIGGSFRGTATLAAGGPSGKIGTFTTGRSLYGNVSATQGIGTIRVGTVYGSQGTHSGQGITKFVTNGDFLTGAVLDVNKTLQNLIIGGDFQDGAIVKAGVFGTTTIVGQNQGDLITK